MKQSFYHYKVVNSLDETDIPLDSSRREEFNGYPDAGRAYMIGLGSKNENRLSDLYEVVVYPANEEAMIEEAFKQLRQDEIIAENRFNEYCDNEYDY